MTVLIVGAGPSGLVLARVLADSGVPFRIIDRKAGPVRESRAAIVHVRTLELLERLGLRAGGVPIERVEVYARGRELATFSLATHDQATPLALPQARWIVGADGASSRCGTRSAWASAVRPTARPGCSPT